MRAWAAAILVLALAGAATAAGPADRLDHFRDLARTYAETPEPGVDGPLLSELFQIVDAEIADNLRSGEPFSSTAFIQSRLDAFSDEWGGASFKVTEPSGGVRRAPVIGLFTLTYGEPRSSLRIYDRAGALLAASTHAGQLELRPWPSAAGAGQFLASWIGAQTSTDARTVSLELWSVRGTSAPRRDWSSDEVFPVGLSATGLSARDGRLVVRYEVRYPGWKSGCADQTEQEDIYRPPPRGTGLRLTHRRVLNGWHRELQAAIARFFDALNARDRKTLTALVSDPTLRARLPSGLRPESVCDERRVAAPTTVLIGATREHDGQRVPWSLTWRRESRGWRLATAGPVLE
jgi:hypothetical protein